MRYIGLLILLLVVAAVAAFLFSGQSPKDRAFKAHVNVELIVDYSNTGKFNEAIAVYDKLKALAASHPNEPGLRRQQALACTKLVWNFGLKGKLAEAHNAYEELKALAAVHQDESPIVEELCTAATRLSMVYSFKEKLPELRGMYEEFKSLAAIYKDEMEFLYSQVWIGRQLVIAYEKAGDKVQAKTISDEIEPIAKSLPENHIEPTPIEPSL